MKHLIYVPLETLDMRYTDHLNKDIVRYLTDNLIDYYSVGSNSGINEEPDDGMFLHAGRTINVKGIQLAKIANLYTHGHVTDHTTFFFSDLWFPGIEAIPYLNFFHGVHARITGIIHAGSFTDSDYVNKMQRWASKFEEMVFDISDTIYCGSEFLKRDIMSKRVVDESKLVVTPLPLDSSLPLYVSDNKENIVVFNGRLCDEKQPHLFKELSILCRMHGWQFISTQDHRYGKEEYYRLLGRAKIVVSFALQENFGYGIAEAVKLGCYPILPNRLCYPEMYPPECLYDNFYQCVDKVIKIMYEYDTIEKPELNFTNPFLTWFK